MRCISSQSAGKGGRLLTCMCGKLKNILNLTKIPLDNLGKLGRIDDVAKLGKITVSYEL